jgi:hypothetical protein
MRDDTATPAAALSRALVCVGEAADPVRPAPRPLAAFMTQLLACEARLPPFRRSRRVGSDAGASTYEAVGDSEALARPSRFERVL